MTQADAAKLERITTSIDTVSNLLEVIQERLDDELPSGAAQYLALIDGAAAVLRHEVVQPLNEMVVRGFKALRIDFDEEAPDLDPPFKREF